MPRPTKCAVSENARTHTTAPIRGYLPVFGNALQMADCVVELEGLEPANKQLWSAVSAPCVASGFTKMSLALTFDWTSRPTRACMRNRPRH